MDERALLARRLRMVLERLSGALEEIPAERLDQAPLGEGTSSPAVIAAHVTGAVRGWALGIGCGWDVPRDRQTEFGTRGESAEALASRLRTLAGEVEQALAALEPARLDEVVLPPQHLVGIAPATEITRREAVVSALQHAAEHLGELQLTRDMLRRQ